MRKKENPRFKGTRGRMWNSILAHERPLGLSVGHLGSPRNDKNKNKAKLESAQQKILKYVIFGKILTSLVDWITYNFFISQHFWANKSSLKSSHQAATNGQGFRTIGPSGDLCGHFSIWKMTIFSTIFIFRSRRSYDGSKWSQWQFWTFENIKYSFGPLWGPYRSVEEIWRNLMVPT